MALGNGLYWGIGTNGVGYKGSVVVRYLEFLLEGFSPFLDRPIVIVHLLVL